MGTYQSNSGSEKAHSTDNRTASTDPTSAHRTWAVMRMPSNGCAQQRACALFAHSNEHAPRSGALTQGGLSCSGLCCCETGKHGSADEKERGLSSFFFKPPNLFYASRSLGDREPQITISAQCLSER